MANVTTKVDLVINRLSQQKYDQLSAAGLLNPNQLYVTSGGADAVLETRLVAGKALSADITAADISSAISLDQYLTAVPSDYKTYDETKQSLSGDGYATQAQLDTKSAISVDNEHADANILHISQEDYSQLVVDDATISNVVYVISSDYIEAYGQQIKNVAEPTDLSDAATKGYVDNAVQGVQIPTDLSAFTNSPGYLISTDISGYYKKTETSSAVEISSALADKADILPFAQTYQDMMDGEPERHMWSPDVEYSAGVDTVAYEGKFFLCTQNADSSHPPTDTDYWTPIPYSIYAQYNGFSMLNVTWEMLVRLRDDGHLCPGMKYRITDYVTAVDQEDCRSAGHQFDLIVTAIDNHTLDEHAVATLPSNGDNYFAARPFHVADYQQYLEYARVPLESWEIKYCLDNDKTRFKFADTTNGKGVIYYMKDEFGNEAPYDFKNVQFKRYKITSSPGASGLEGMYGLAVGNIEVDTSDEMWCYTFNGADYADFGLSEPYDFSGWHVRPTQAVLQQFGGPSIERLQECTGNAIQARQEDADDYSLMSFKLPNNVFHCALTNAPVSQLPFLKIGYCGGNKLGLNCYDNTFGHSQLFNVLGDYCRNNTFSNDCNYNTFGNDCNNNTFGDSCYSNTFGNSCYGNTFDNDCNSNTFGNDCISNTFGNSCYSNTFGNVCNGNTFGNNCYNNTFGNECNSNTFGNDCNSNTFGDSCCNNTFGYSCNYNTFGNDCNSNTFGNDCNSNTFGNSCYSNTFGNVCNGNTFGRDCYSNTFGNDCDSNTFGDNCSYIKFAATNTSDPSQAKSYYKYITVDSGNQYILLNCTQSTYSGHEYKNVRILPGVNNTTTFKTITDSNVNQSFCTTYQPANSQVIAV